MRGAMVGGAGYMAGKSAAKHSAQQSEQEQRLSDLEAQQAPPAAQAAPAAAGGLDPAAIEQLKQLAELRDSGVLTTEEFEAQKQKLLGG